MRAGIAFIRSRPHDGTAYIIHNCYRGDHYVTGHYVVPCAYEHSLYDFAGHDVPPKKSKRVSGFRVWLSHDLEHGRTVNNTVKSLNNN